MAPHHLGRELEDRIPSIGPEAAFLHAASVSQSVQSLRCVWLFATPWTTARQASLSITNSKSLCKLMSIE